MNPRRALPVTLGLATCLIGAPASAQSGAWVTNGPNGGSVSALAVDPGQPAIVYAGTGSGVFRSDGSGGTWHYRSQDLGGRTVRTSRSPFSKGLYEPRPSSLVPARLHLYLQASTAGRTARSSTPKEPSSRCRRHRHEGLTFSGGRAVTRQSAPGAQ
jgi:hypothetical protein